MELVQNLKTFSVFTNLLVESKLKKFENQVKLISNKLYVFKYNLLFLSKTNLRTR